MKLYVCWTAKELHLPRPGGHPCANAHDAIVAAGYRPEVIKARSFAAFPRFLQTADRKLVEEKTGSAWVPALETDDGEWISGSEEIIGWAAKNPTAATDA